MKRNEIFVTIIAVLLIGCGGKKTIIPQINQTDIVSKLDTSHVNISSNTSIPLIVTSVPRPLEHTDTVYHEDSVHHTDTVKSGIVNELNQEMSNIKNLTTDKEIDAASDSIVSNILLLSENGVKSSAKDILKSKKDSIATLYQSNIVLHETRFEFNCNPYSCGVVIELQGSNGEVYKHVAYFPNKLSSCNRTIDLRAPRMPKLADKRYYFLRISPKLPLKINCNNETI